MITLSCSRLAAFSLAVALASGMEQTACAANPTSSLDAAGHRLTVRTLGETDHVIDLDGVPLSHDTNNERIGLLGPYTGQEHTYVLLAESAGGNACEMQFQAVDLTTSPVRLSPVFGNCSPDVHVKIKTGELHVTTSAATRDVPVWDHQKSPAKATFSGMAYSRRSAKQ